MHSLTTNVEVGSSAEMTMPFAVCLGWTNDTMASRGLPCGVSVSSSLRPGHTPFENLLRLQLTYVRFLHANDVVVSL